MQDGVGPRACTRRDEGLTGVASGCWDCGLLGDGIRGLDIPVGIGCDLAEGTGGIVHAARAVRPGAQVVLELGEVRVRIVVGAKQRQWGLIVVVGGGRSHDEEEVGGR